MRIDKNTTIRLGDRNIVKVKLGDVVIWQKTTEPVVGPDYFYIESLGDGNTISVKNKGNGNTSNVTPTLEYSKDKNTWNTITFDWTSGEHTTKLPIKLNTGEKMYFRNDTRKFSNSYDSYISFLSSVSSNVGGDIRTLSNYLDVNSETTSKSNMFRNLFYNNKNIVNASNLRLPYTTLAYDCYSSMFNGCNSLTTAPELPVTTLASSCYRYMFQGCTSLTSAPTLPATTLADYCYYHMFQGCTSLTTAPALPATTLADYCYYSMFQGCTSLTTAPTLPATTLANYCYYSMFQGCTSLTTAPALPATTLASDCYYSMFQGCTSLTTAPALPATTLANYCYYSMFQGCTSLTTAPALPATTLASDCYESMFQGCSSLNKILVYANSGTTSGNINNWLNGVAASGTFYNVGGETYTQDSASGIPTGWSEVTTVSTTSVYVEPNTFSVKSWETMPKLNYIIFAENEIGIDVQMSKTVSPQIGENTGSSTRTITQTYSYDGIDYTLTINQTANDTDEPEYFYIESLDDGNTVTLNTYLGTLDYLTFTTPTLQFSTDKRNWSTVTFDWSKTGNKNIDIPTVLNNGDKMYFRNDTDKFSYGINDSIYAKDCSKISFSTNKNTNVGGDIRTLINYIDVETSSMLYRGTFNRLFEINTHIVDASNLRLPYTSLESDCYTNMFQGCSSLTTAPALPATSLASSCYRYMFQGCSSLTTAPALPATSLASSCYRYMFQDCTSLTTAPALPDTTLADYCYCYMFYGCSSLTTAPALPATTLASNCYESMFYGCSKLTTAPALPATTLADYCYTNMFNGCYSLTTAPELPATTLASYCYESMFQGCSKLTTTPVLPATTLEYHCYTSMFQGCSKLTTAPELPVMNLRTGCYESMFQGCTSLTTAPALPATTLETSCYYSMFQGCTSLTTAPILPATYIVDYGYSSIFNGCTSLTSVTIYATNASYYSHGSWLNNVAPSGTVYNNGFLDLPKNSASGIPTGWSEVVPEIQSITVNPDTFTIEFNNETVTCNSTLEVVTTVGTFTKTNSVTLTVGENTGDTTRTITKTIPYYNSSYDVTIVQSAIQSITVNPDTFTIKSYKDTVKCNSTLTITTTLGTTVTDTNSATLTVGENTGDTTRTLTETIPYKGSSYQVTIVQTANDVKPTFSWNVVSTGTYPFELNTNGYYESTNKGHDNSYSYATLNYEGFDELVLECINSGESNYDYGIISQPDVQLGESTSDDGATGSTNVFHNFKVESSTNPVQLTIPSDKGSHFITIKFRKDSSQAQGNDSLQFNVIEP